MDELIKRLLSATAEVMPTNFDVFAEKMRQDLGLIVERPTGAEFLDEPGLVEEIRAAYNRE